MTRPSTPWRRALALFLASQPVLWMSDVALAQTLEQQGIEAQRRDQERVQQQPQQLPGETQRLQPYGPAPGQQPGGVPSGPQPMRTGTGLFAPATPAEQDPGRPERPTGALPVTGQNPVDEPLDPERYVLGPGDVLDLHFWGVENFRLRVALDLEGRAFVPRSATSRCRERRSPRARGPSGSRSRATSPAWASA